MGRVIFIPGPPRFTDSRNRGGAPLFGRPGFDDEQIKARDGEKSSCTRYGDMRKWICGQEEEKTVVGRGGQDFPGYRGDLLSYRSGSPFLDYREG